MRSLLFSLFVLLGCPGDGASPNGAPEPPSSAEGAATGPATASPTASAPATAAPRTAVERNHAVVRVDPSSFESRRLGTIRFEPDPPFRAEVVEGDEALRAIVNEMNSLDHVMSAGVGGPPERIGRSHPDFLRIMEFGWLGEKHHVELRLPGKAGATRRFLVVSVDDGTPLGTVERDDMHYLAVVEGPERRRLGEILAPINRRRGESVDAVPPPGESGKWGRLIARGTPQFGAMLRDRLYREGALLVPDGRVRPQTLRLEGAPARGGRGRWLSVQVPGGLSVAPTSGDEILHLAGPPGGPLSCRILRYRGVAPDAAALEAHVRSKYGAEPSFRLGRAGEIEVAERKLPALSFRTHDGPATTFGVVALWPSDIDPDGAPKRDDGVAVELLAAGADRIPTLEEVARHVDLAALLDSLFIDFDAAP